jgi:putative ABC transport system permease protein
VAKVAGRLFDDHDTDDSPGVVIVSQSLADRYWPGESALGKRMKRGRADSAQPWLTVVGVVATLDETRDEVIDNADAWYLPYTQSTFPALDRMTFMVHTRSAPLAVVGAVKAALRGVDPEEPIFDLQTMDQRFAERTAQDRFSAFLYGALGLLGVGLAAMGIYAMLSFTVDQRRREIGIRAALGARPGQIGLAVLGRAAALTAAGLGLGTVAAFGLTGFLASRLYQVDPHDPAALATASGILGLCALVSSYLPALRASRLDPLLALRSE